MTALAVHAALAAWHPLVHLLLDASPSPIPTSSDVVPIASPSPSASPLPVFGAGVFNASFLLSVLIWTPVLMAGVIAILPSPRGRLDRAFMPIAFWTLALLGALALIGYTQFQLYASGVQFEENVAWLPAFGIRYHLGLDGIGIALMLLSLLVGLAAILAAYHQHERPREFFVLLLLAVATFNGFAAARDVFLLILFWTASIAPLGLLVAGWGGRRRRPAAARLAAFWGLGTLFLVAASVLLHQGSGSVGWDFDTLLRSAPHGRLQVVFGLLLLAAAATRLPIFPLHGWIRDVLADAHPAVAVLIAGMAAREGGYLLVRLLVGGAPDAARVLASGVAMAGAATVVFAAAAALRSGRVRRVGAYLAMIPGGITLIGIGGLTATSLNGATLNLFTGGVAAALVVGAAATLAIRAQSDELRVVSGIAARAPKIAWIMFVAGLGVIGMPMLGTFTSQLMVLMGSFRYQAAAAALGLAGLALAGAAVAWTAQRVLFGAPAADTPAGEDTNLSESWYLGLLVGVLLWVGLAPGGPRLAGIPLFDPGLANVVNASVSDLASPYVIPQSFSGAVAVPAAPAPRPTP